MRPIGFEPMQWVRALAADAVQRVGNGHPGTAMALAPVAYLLFQKVMRHDPRDPSWLGRDRFVLSPGHSSLTLYSQLFLSDYGLSMADLESFRTWGSRTPGHPEHGHTAGVETTTGPLGQGLATAVGMAMSALTAGRDMAERARSLTTPDQPLHFQCWYNATNATVALTDLKHPSGLGREGSRPTGWCNSGRW